MGRSCLLACGVLVVSWGWVVGGTYSGGSGTAEDPYRIATPADMTEFSTSVGSAFFIMVDDVDMTGTSWVPMSTWGGVFDGAGHAISNLEIVRPTKSSVAMFQSYYGVMKNVRLLNVHIEGQRLVGTVAAQAFDGSQISGCYVSGTVICHGDKAGGLIGGMRGGEIVDCQGDVVVNGGNTAGGLAGSCDGGVLRRCRVRASVSGERSLGGLLGGGDGESLVTECISEGTVTASGDYVGGLMGGGRASYCYSSAAVSGADKVGGLAGTAGWIKQCYSTGSVTGSGQNVGGLLGYGDILDSYWDAQTSGIADSVRGLGLPTARMKQMLTYSLNLWDGAVWTIDDGNDYPRLAWENAPGAPIGSPTVPLTGSGTAEEPYEIATVDDYSLLTFSKFLWDKHYILLADLDLAAEPQPDLGLRSIEVFSGSFNGNAHVIRNLSLDDRENDCLGMFGELNGPVTRLGLENVTIHGGKTVGGLAGVVGHVTISECYVTGEVSGYYESSYADGEVGGVAGSNNGGIVDCWTDVSVGGTAGRIAGLAAWGGTIRRCYAIGTVAGTAKYYGGLAAGYEKANVYDSFFDVDTTGTTANSGGGRGLKTALMQDMRTYGWNGWAGSVWRLDAGNDYPHLAWENRTGTVIEAPPILLAGSGTEAEPYQIAVPEDYAAVTLGRCFWDKCLLLANDLDLAGADSLPIGYDLNHVFSGTFDGGGHVIRNLTIDLPQVSYVGMFGFSTGTVRDVGLVDVRISADDYVGGVAGRTAGTLRRCYAAGEVAGDMSVGGLAGENAGVLAACYARCSVSGSVRVGGLAGASGDNVSYCYSIGSAGGIDRVGGLIGSAGNLDKLVQCYAAVAVSGQEDYVGGLIGYASSGRSVCCFWDRDIAGVMGNGKGRGLVTAHLKEKETYVFNFWDESTWTIDDGTDYPHLWWEGVPGETLRFEVTMQGDGTKSVPYEVCTSEDFMFIGVGRYFWDKHFVLMNDLDMTGVPVCTIGEGSSGDAFRGSFDGRAHIIRYLRMDAPEQDRLGAFGYIETTAWVRGLGLEAITVHGNSEVGGLSADLAGTVSDCHVTGEVTGYLSVGGLVGVSIGGEIRRCYARAGVTGCTEIGGLVGYNASAYPYGSERQGLVSQCYTACTVTCTECGTDQYVGGLSGSGLGRLENSYSASIVHADTVRAYCFAGGLAGMAGLVDKCYSCGPVSTSGAPAEAGALVGRPSPVTGSLWDKDASGTSFSNGGDGKSTIDMLQMETYLQAGWDFAGEADNGTDDIWTMCEGTNYPRLAWQVPQADIVCPDGVAMEDFAALARAWLTGPEDVHWNSACDLLLSEPSLIGPADVAIMSDQWLEGWTPRPSLLPISHWMFDDAGGNGVADAGLLGRNGTLVNMADDAWVEGKVGGGLMFGGVDDYVTIPGWDGIGGGRSRTCCAWIKTADTSGEIVSWGIAAAGARWNLVTEPGGRLRLEVGGGAIVGSTSICDGQWHHVAAVLENDGTPNVKEVRLYVDGALEALSSAGDRAIYTVVDSVDSPDVAIGVWLPAGRYFEGVIDEVRIYDRALSAAEVALLAE